MEKNAYFPAFLHRKLKVIYYHLNYMKGVFHP